MILGSRTWRGIFCLKTLGFVKMKLMNSLSAGAAAIALSTAFATVVAPTPAEAQQTTADIRGVVTDGAGAPISGASITIVDANTGSTRQVSSDAQGRFSAQNLSVTGNYTITATAPGLQGQSIENVRLSLGDTTALNFALSSGVSDEIVVVGTRSVQTDVAIGPNSTFDFDDIQGTPAISRDIKEIIRQDPRLFIDESEGNGLQCAGASPRFNSLTVDGIRLNDNFGLNSNGYPTERLPFPLDSINQVAVELAPFDVEYGGFTGCNVNAVTRSGENEFHGSAWFDYTSDTFRGGSVEGSSFDKGDFSDFRFGATLSGPIIKDKLFFFAAYEKINETEIFGRGPAEAGVTGVQGVSQAQLDRIFNIAQTVYGYTPTPLPPSAGEDDEKILAKLDWNINDNHRLALTYNYINGFNQTASDDDPDEYESFDHYYLRSTKLRSYSGQVFSDWTDNFSTELRVSFTDNDTGQVSNDTTSFGEVRIETYNPATGDTADVYIGGDDSRQANRLATETFNLKFKADYRINNHFLTFGYEQEKIDVFNLFIQHTQGEFRFDGSSFSDLVADPDAEIDNFETGAFLDDSFYGNSVGTNNPEDGAAEFAYTTHSIYVQDDIDLGDWQFNAGVRFDWYSSDDLPTLNPNFEARNGFNNQTTFDGESLIQPRFGFNYNAADNLTIRGGAGIFSGGNPNVWLSNSYQNDSQRTFQSYRGNISNFNLLPWVNGDAGNENTPFWGVLQEQFDEVANASAANGGVNAIDPDFEIPSQWKAAIGATYNFWNDTTLVVDFLYTKDRVAASIIDATLTQIGTAPDGRPIYNRIDRADPACVADVTSAACIATDRPRANDFILTNNDGGSQKVISAALYNDHEFDSGVRFNWGLGYAYTDAKDRNPMTSSVAFSNFVNFSTSDPNNPPLATSNYEVPHRFTVRAGVSYPFFGEYETSVRLFGQISQSRPYSFIFDDAGDVFGDELDSRHLLYVPDGPNDPNVVFNPGFDQAAFFALVNTLGLDQFAGGIAPRNAFQSDWFSQWDLRFEQELPGLFDGHRTQMFVVIDNIGNLLNDEWGVVNQAGFPGEEDLVALDESVTNAQGLVGINDSGQYVFDSFTGAGINSTADIFSPVVNASVWEIRFGVRYEF